MRRHVGRLHLVTDTRPGRDVLGTVAAALAAGVDTVQVWVEAHIPDRAAYELAAAVVERCRTRGASCLVDNRLHIALAVGADGGHLGVDDLPVAVARRVLGPKAVLGVTVRDPEAARRAIADGADYVGVGPVYLTSTADGQPEPLGPAGIAAVAAVVTVPVIATGGVTAERISALRAAGAYGVAVVDAVSAAADPGAAVAQLSRALA